MINCLTLNIFLQVFVSCLSLSQIVRWFLSHSYFLLCLRPTVKCFFLFIYYKSLVTLSKRKKSLLTNALTLKCSHRNHFIDTIFVYLCFSLFVIFWLAMTSLRIIFTHFVCSDVVSKPNALPNIRSLIVYMAVQPKHQLFRRTKKRNVRSLKKCVYLFVLNAGWIRFYYFIW